MRRCRDGWASGSCVARDQGRSRGRRRAPTSRNTLATGRSARGRGGGVRKPDAIVIGRCAGVGCNRGRSRADAQAETAEGARGIEDKATDPTLSSLAATRPCADDERGGGGGRADGGTAQLSVSDHGLTKDIARADASGAMCAPAMRARASAARSAAAAKCDRGMATKREDGRARAERLDSWRHHRASRRVAHNGSSPPVASSGSPAAGLSTV